MNKSKNLCNCCYKNTLISFIDLGETPLANSYTKKIIGLKYYPLHVFYCENCHLVQHNTKIKGETIFNYYQYFSSYSSGFVKHSKQNILRLIKKYKIDITKTVTEVASNDGYLLKHLIGSGINFYGIEPAKNISEYANKSGVRTINKYLNQKSAKSIIKKNKKSDLIIANNVLAHVPDINDFVKSLKILLKKNGVMCIEVPYFKNLINKNQFDTIYHEHFYYYSLSSLLFLFKKHGLKIFDIDIIKTHGGSFRIHVTYEKNKNYKISNKVKLILKEEIKNGFQNKKKYQNFTLKIEKLKKNVIEYFNKNKNKNIIGFGAAAKACTFINYFNLQKKIRFIIDETPEKVGNYIPGTNIKIKSLPKKLTNSIDIIIIFPWNHYKEIKQKIEARTIKKIKLVRFIPQLKEDSVI